MIIRTLEDQENCDRQESAEHFYNAARYYMELATEDADPEWQAHFNGLAVEMQQRAAIAFNRITIGG